MPDADSAPVIGMVVVPDKERVIVIEESSAEFKLFSLTGKFLHSHLIKDYEEETAITGAIHDIAWLSDFELTAVTTSDHRLILLTEQLSSTGHHRQYAVKNQVVLKDSHVKLGWVPVAAVLFSVDSANVVHVWDLKDEPQSSEVEKHRSA